MLGRTEGNYLNWSSFSAHLTHMFITPGPLSLLLYPSLSLARPTSMDCIIRAAFSSDCWVWPVRKWVEEWKAEESKIEIFFSPQFSSCWLVTWQWLVFVIVVSLLFFVFVFLKAIAAVRQLCHGYLLVSSYWYSSKIFEPMGGHWLPLLLTQKCFTFPLLPASPACTVVNVFSSFNSFYHPFDC